jgi:hypothetical protein
MEKEFVPYELAVKLKTLGYDEPCLCSWNFYTNELNFNGQPSTFSSEDVIQLPTFSQAFRWFREKYNIHSFIIPLIDEVGFVYKYQARVHTKESAVEIIGEFETCEEAELACLEKLIELTFKSE